jgi:UDP-N-acetylmuramate--alanine ligase
VKNGVQVIDDYAHHPTEITATINALAELSPKRLIIVFQPHRYSRTAALYRDLAKALAPADIVVLTEIYPANEEPLSGVSSGLIARELEAANHPNVQTINRDDLVVRYLQSTCRPGDLVVTMGAGDIRKLGERFVSRSM